MDETLKKEQHKFVAYRVVNKQQQKYALRGKGTCREALEDTAQRQTPKEAQPAAGGMRGRLAIK